MSGHDSCKEGQGTEAHATVAFAFNSEFAEDQGREDQDGEDQVATGSKKIRYPPIRLSRSASARTMAVIEHNKARASREAEGIFSGSLEGASGGAAQGVSLTKAGHTSSPGKRQKLGNAAALDLIRRIYEETKAEFDPIGKADSDKLSSLQIGGASTVLQTLTWREFFRGKTIEAKKREMTIEAEREAHRVQTRIEEIKAGRLVNKMHYLARTEGPQAVVVDPGKTPSSSSLSTSPLSPTKRRIEEIRLQRTAEAALLIAPPARSSSKLGAFSSLCQRVEALWLELQMSSADQSFFRKSLLAAPPSGGECSEQHLVELARYLGLLQDHKQATIKAVQASQSRGESILRLRHVLGKIDAFEGRVAARGQVLREASAVDLFGTPFDLGDPAVESCHNPLPPALRAELVSSVKDVQITTLNLIRRVQKWRKNLWRPRAFMVAGIDGVEVDCFLEMQRDVSSLLAGKGSNQTMGYFVHLSDLPLFPWDLGCIIFSPDIDVGADEMSSATSSPDWVRLDVSLRETFLENGPSRKELIAANRLVLGHVALQRSLQQEQRALLAKRAFIPMLKVPPSSPASVDIVAGLWSADGAPADTAGDVTTTQALSFLEPGAQDRGREVARQLLRGGLWEDDQDRRSSGTATEEVNTSTPHAVSPVPKPRSASPTNRSKRRGKGKKAKIQKTPISQPMPRPPDVGHKRECCHEADHAARRRREQEEKERADIQEKLARIQRRPSSSSPSRGKSRGQGHNGSMRRHMLDADERDLEERVRDIGAELSNHGNGLMSAFNGLQDSIC